MGDESIYSLGYGLTSEEIQSLGNYGASTSTTSSVYDSDYREAIKLDPYVAKPAGDTRPWYERVAEYGLTRAIDSNYGPSAVNKTSTGATFAGQNGLTYSQVGRSNTAQQTASVGNLLPWLLAGAVALFALG